MTFDEAVTAAAHVADGAVNEVLADYRDGVVTDEDDINPYLLGALSNKFRGAVGGLTWRSSVLRHRSGIAAEEQRIGADMLIHVSLKTETQTYSKGVLIQAKRVESGDLMNTRELNELINQCNKMLLHSPAAFVFNYSKNSMRCGSANKLVGSKNKNLHDACDWTSYRFFLELFRCPIGDRNIRSPLVRDLRVPIALTIKGSGQLTLPIG